MNSIIGGMNKLPAEIYSVASVRAVDRAAIDDVGIPGFTLMMRAGEAALDAAVTRYPDAKRWQVLCGGGNNAGDGYVVARIAQEWGIDVSVVALVNPADLTGDAASAYQEFADDGGVAVAWDGALDESAEFLVDALLGNGLERPVGGEYAAAVNALNQHPAPVMALDIPTGLHGDSGEILGTAVAADLTVTFVGLKSGLFLGDGLSRCGTVVLADLDIPASCFRAQPVLMHRIDTGRMAEALAPRQRIAHKGDFGHVLVIGGGPGMPGAARLCGEAALRAGAGRVSIATAPGHAASIASACPELMVSGIESEDELEPLLANADVIAIGPGLGRSDWAAALCRRLAADRRPAVWDADALRGLAEQGEGANARIITPHPGEAAALLGITSAEVQADRLAAVAALQSRFGGTVVLKGAGSLIQSAGVPPAVCTAGNPGMATAGMGDVLTGVVAALLAQGLSADEAGQFAVQAHATAGDRAASAGQRGMLASDVIAELRGVVNP